MDGTNLSHEELEEGAVLALDFDKLEKVAACGEALVPVAVQDADSGEVLIVAYANAQALDYALANGVAAFWSTSRNELWVKGATSGDFLDLVEVLLAAGAKVDTESRIGWTATTYATVRRRDEVVEALRRAAAELPGPWRGGELFAVRHAIIASPGISRATARGNRAGS